MSPRTIRCRWDTARARSSHVGWLCTGDVSAVVGHTLSDGYNVVVAGCGCQKSLRDGNADLQPYPGTKGCWGSDATVPTSVCMTSTLSFVLSAHRGVGYTVVCVWRISQGVAGLSFVLTIETVWRWLVRMVVAVVVIALLPPLIPRIP